MNEFNTCSKFTIKDYLAMIKVFLKFLYSYNYIKEPIHIFLPKVIVPRQSKIPSVWDEKDIEKLLSSIDRNTA